jgi:hypothetical protein
MFQKKVVEKIKTHVVLNNLFSENSPVYGIMWKNAVELGEATDNNKTHARFMLDN